ncbi:MAG: DUF4199 domain-containing protein [Daejeonella sp.]|uniref:DUF4199 domain-containing protein n=1 Tax=Daejeonella sp. TaxID=2805397 RepID=UPI003C72B3D4
MELPLQNLNKAAATNGLIIGILAAILGIVTYYVAPAMMGNMWFGIGNMLFLLLVYIFFTIDLRKKIGGYWSFKQALKGIFLMALIAGLVLSVTNYVFYKFIEPNAFEKISVYVEEGMTKTLEGMGMDSDQIETTVEEQVNTMRKQYDPSPMDLLQNLGVAILIEFIMSLIFAAIFKKEPPIFAPVEDDVD